MRWSFRVASIAGIGIYLHITFLMLIAFFAFAFFAKGGLAGAIQGTAGILAIFVCVLLHELGHALTARRFHVKTRDIILLPIGGVARLERMPREPWHEFFIAIAGPLVNVALALLVYGTMEILGISFEEYLERLAQADTPNAAMELGWKPFLFQLLGVNIMIFVFNLIPAFPMDGGRILRSLLALKLSHTQATRVAAAVGQGFAILFGLVGLGILGPMGPNFILVLIAVFIFLGAAGEASAAEMHLAFQGLPTARGMISDFKTLTSSDTLGNAVELLLRGNQVDFPIVEEGRIAGMLTRQQLVASLREHGPESKVSAAPLKAVTPIDAELPLYKAYEEMNRQETSSLPVLHQGKLVGLLTAENIAELAMVRKALDPGR